ncbi:sensor histidine kinase [Cohnella sp. 56]|uniref:sensor histidine kinase n=1 Tax=Cohnella sp. 56 TaxID=3113722 RepID=UPI0030E780AE
MANRLFRPYLNLSVRYKILFWFVPLLALTISATGVYSYNIAAHELTTKIGAEQTSAAKQAIDHLDYIAQDAGDIFNYLFLTPDIQSLVSSDPSNDNYVNKTAIDAINRLMVTRPYFQYLTLYSAHFGSIQFNNKGLSPAISFEEYRERFDYDRLLRRSEMEWWSVETPGGGDSRIFPGDTKNKLLLTKVLKNDYDYEPEGIIIIGIDEKDIRRSYAPSGDISEIYVIGTDGMVYSDSSGSWTGQSMHALPFLQGGEGGPESLARQIDTARWVYADVISPLTGWHVLVVQPRSEMLRQLSRIQWLTAVIICVTIVLSLILSWAVSGLISKPIRKVLISMKKFQKGDFTQQVRVIGHDEVGQLGLGYNTMVGRIRELIDDVYAFQLKQKQAELKALQSQINPHFLYNTLNTIAWTAHKSGDALVEEMIYALSGMFRISLNQGMDASDLKQEFELIGHYLFLQKMRFPSKLNYELELDERIADFAVPKLLIQPLVENAVVHGIESLVDDVGLVHVAAAAEGGRVVIEVTDNGIGISEDKRSRLAQMIRSERLTPEGESYALQNIAARIRLFYGEGASVDVQSEAGSGTRLRIELPYERK